MRGRPNQHQWDYMGYDTERKVEYGYCDLCKKYRECVPNEKGFISGFTFIRKKYYLERLNSGKVEIK